MEKQMSTGKAMENLLNNRPKFESSIVDTMNRYFRDDKGKMGDLELLIMDSIKRYFKEPPPKNIA